MVEKLNQDMGGNKAGSAGNQYGLFAIECNTILYAIDSPVHSRRKLLARVVDGIHYRMMLCCWL